MQSDPSGLHLSAEFPAEESLRLTLRYDTAVELHAVIGEKSSGSGGVIVTVPSLPSRQVAENARKVLDQKPDFSGGIHMKIIGFAASPNFMST